jgi:hypothetical protein
MSQGRWKAAVPVLALAVLGYGLMSLPDYNLRAAQPAGATPPIPGPAKPGGRNLELAKAARLLAARKAFAKVWDLYRRGWYDEEQVYRWSVRLAEAERALTATKAARVHALQGHLSRMRELEQWAPERVPIGTRFTAPPGGGEGGRAQLRMNKDDTIILLAKGISREDIAVLTSYYRAEAEAWLAEAKAE